ncbi:DUF397 domain-containing protein [Streptomyces sp. NPDC014733]|uniref:DUF397 domain-containing protein n=1 Tax=Streptomyces sp. NPDC014733 TaxID=3364885 RepID=UPI0036FEB1B4
MSPDVDLTAAEWVKSSYSDANGGQCVEFSRTFAWVKSSYSEGNGGACLEFAPAAQAHGIVPVRDSKNPDGPALVFPAGHWTAFIKALEGGEFRAI